MSIETVGTHFRSNLCFQNLCVTIRAVAVGVFAGLWANTARVSNVGSKQVNEWGRDSLHPLAKRKLTREAGCGTGHKINSRVKYNNAFRNMLRLLWWCSASGMFAVNIVEEFLYCNALEASALCYEGE